MKTGQTIKYLENCLEESGLRSHFIMGITDSGEPVAFGKTLNGGDYLAMNAIRGQVPICPPIRDEDDD